MLMSAVIQKVRELVNDTDQPQRYSDSILVAWVNEALRRIALIRPELFTVFVRFPCVPGVLQQLPQPAIRLVEVFMASPGNGGGEGSSGMWQPRAVSEVDREAMDRADPGWVAAPAGVPLNWVRHPRNDRAFFVYPPAAAGVTLLVEYATTPPAYALHDDITVLNDAFVPALVSCTVFLVESVDDQHVNSGRAKLFQDEYLKLLGTNLQAQTTIDTEGNVHG